MTATTRGPRIALISAVTAAIPPATTALTAAFDDVEIWNLLDDRLLSDARDAGDVTPALRDRMRRLIAHARREGADGVLLTCSLYGAVADAYDAEIPVLSPDGAAFEDLAEAAYSRVLVVASIPSALEDSLERLRTVLEAKAVATELDGVVVPGAAAAAASGDVPALAAAISQALLDRTADAIFLAQYSLAPAGELLSAERSVPVISGPASSARLLRQELQR